ncbi:FAD-binding domain-containing protein [Aspergillus pseudodeflectus]|uniref:FAD-binding domain-containing protein n=1 Tax=Aspergillus pseudodeflectus TaxID=176178 RepID=A0ABR4KAV1_9EURO
MVQLTKIVPLALLTGSISAFPLNKVTCPDGLCQVTRASIGPAQVAQELGPLLSEDASIFGPDDGRWDAADANWNEYWAPHFTVVVVAGQEADVPIIIQYANRNGINFYARNRGHAVTESRGKFHGLQINMQQLRGWTLSDDRTYATIQGGAYGQEFIDQLWEHNLTATTGSCSCVGLLGPGLGGGWGKWQGHHGLISDNIRSLNVVLANGRAITVNATSYPDLFWGMRGAGHNFGVVTSFDMNVYPPIYETWYQKNYVFTPDKLEPLFEALNVLNDNGNQPLQMAEQSGTYALDPTIDATQATVRWQFSWAGPQEDAEPYLAPFDALGPVFVEELTVPYPRVAEAAGSSVGQQLCDEGVTRAVAPATLLRYNITTQREIFEIFNERIFVHPALNYSFVVMEAYSLDAVRAVDAADSAYPWRDENLYLQTTISYPKGDEDLYADFAIDWVTQNQRLFNAGQPGRQPVSYVNYGSGRESVEATYGYEPWRLERLRGLKAKYDPENKFAYFGPIIPPN